MLIIALVLALIGLVALVFAVVTSNELVAWVCIGASVLGVVLLIVDALRERQQRVEGRRRSSRLPTTRSTTRRRSRTKSRRGRHRRADDATKESTVSAEAGDDCDQVADPAQRVGVFSSLRTSSSLTW